MSLMSLKSGTDIRGTAAGDKDKIQLTNEAVRKIIRGFLRLTEEKTGLKPAEMTISVGHDSRVSAERIKNCAVRELSSGGAKVLDCGLSSTPAMFMTTVLWKCTAAVQITASHHPWDKNGLKFFTPSGGFEGEDIEKLLKYAEEEEISESLESLPDRSEKRDFMSVYAEHLREIIKNGIKGGSSEKPLQGFHIAVDAGNGAGGFYAREVLQKLGADINGSQFLEPDGMFPNHVPNPENEQAMRFISEAAVNSGADLGVIFDTDVDRAACVDEKGREINRNRLIALASVIALEGNSGGTIVTDSVTSDGLKEFIEKNLGGRHHRFKRGYKNVINEAVRLNSEGINCPLAIETSGHAALRENYFLDDGAYLITKIIILFVNLKAQGKDLNSLIADLKEPLEEKELRFKILEENFKEYGEKVIEALKEYAKGREGWTPANDNREGIRISLDRNHGDGWMLLRLSVHDPILPFNAESNSKGGVKMIIDEFGEFIKAFDRLDLSVLP